MPGNGVYSYRPAPRRVTLVERLHRFGARVVPSGGPAVIAHVPNPGRMAELLRPGSIGWMVPSDDPRRRTAGTLVALRHRGTVVSIDTQLPNRLVGTWLGRRNGPRRFGLPDGAWRREVAWGHSRFDLGCRDPDGRLRALVEIKSANLRVGSGVLFPDAPTVRGTRHVRELAEAARRGISSHVVFVVQRGDVGWVGPNRRMDPAFGDACDAAVAAGVRFGAIRLRVRPQGAALGARVPVRDLGPRNS